MSTADAINRAQNAFDDKLAEVRQPHKAIGRETSARKAFAYVAKIVVGISGLLMTLDAVKPYNVPVGVMISILVLLDHIFSNHAKLLVGTQAEQAYRRMIESVEYEHTQQLTPLLAIKESKPEEFSTKLVKLNQDVLANLHTQKVKTDKAIDDADIKALTRLAIEGT